MISEFEPIRCNDLYFRFCNTSKKSANIREISGKQNHEGVNDYPEVHEDNHKIKINVCF